MTDQLPEKGIVLFHGNATRGGDIHPGPNRLLICLKAESPLCPQAQLHVVQNPYEASQFLGCYFIPHWPQPGLQPRLDQRQDKFETIAFLGHCNSLAAELRTPDWKMQLGQRGLNWQPIINTNGWNNQHSIDTRWNDYQHIDAIVAVREFHLKRPGYRSKPATKLYNAWLAGVPAILGRELAYRAEGTVDVNYLEANSMAQVLSCLDELKQNIEFRRRLVKNGQAVAKQYSTAAITQKWIQFLSEVAMPRYQAWCNNSPWGYQMQHWQAQWLNYCDRTLRRLKF
ncbi:glycosyltransferase [Leptothoe sp. PORK10 BA2]|uniref:glycosyltransferase n=1 Tax=Leptothoe sp. PORK10 BA2 TaxID=3110254 RepID=UPI002B20A8EE|nr:hypothetical protein [Leptothoe sp. PORK10 BA2]MEA5465541.1 hypothetical protein [Leptothoe sp. PORK10 BA2]